MRRVDFIGAPGAGKTSLCREMLSRGAGLGLASADDARIMMSLADIRERDRTLEDRALYLLLRIGALRRFHRHLAQLALINHYDSTPWDEEDRGALDAFIEASSSSGFHPQTRLLRFRWLLDAANDVAFLGRLEAYGVDKTFLLDESLAQALAALGPWEDGLSARLEALCPLVGRPSALVLMDLDGEALLERARARAGERVTKAHMRMGQDEWGADLARSAEAARQVAEAMERRGVPVIRVDAGAPLPAQADSVLDALGRLEPAPDGGPLRSDDGPAQL